MVDIASHNLFRFRGRYVLLVLLLFSYNLQSNGPTRDGCCKVSVWETCRRLEGMSRGRARHVLVHAADVPRLRYLRGLPFLHHQLDALHPGTLTYSIDLSILFVLTSMTQAQTRTPMNQGSLNTFLDPAVFIPATDRASLEGLSKGELRAWALRKSEEYRLLSYAMLSLHNDAAPIHTLPVELLMKIFGMTWSREGRLSPTSVCRRWYTLYQSTCAFWAGTLADLWFVERHDKKSWTWGPLKPLSPESLTALLDRSSPHPIPLSINQTFDGAPPLPAYVFPSTVSPHLHHVIDLDIKTTLLHFHDLHRVLNDGMPTLEVLHVRAREEESEPPNFAHTLASLCPVADKSLPRLYRLCLDYAVFFPLIAVRSLKRVTLDYYWPVVEMEPWPYPAGSQSGSLLQLLTRCRNLEYLRFEYFGPSRWWPPLGHRPLSTMVQLPSLKRLSFGDESEASHAMAALAVLDPYIPSTASVDLSLACDDEPIQSLSSIVPSYLVRHHPFDTVVLSGFRSGEWDIRCLAAQALRLRIQFESRRTLADLGIEDAFRTAGVTHLGIISDPQQYFHAMDADRAEGWVAVLRAFPHLTHLTVTGTDAPSGVVNALGAAAEHGVPAADLEVLMSGSPLCPALRYVTLGWEVPREIGPKNRVNECDTATYQPHRDVGARVEHRCSAMQLAFERRASMKAPKLLALEFYEYEKQGFGEEPRDPTRFGELIVSSRRDDNDLPCLERLRTVVGGPVVYRGYLLKLTVYRPPIDV